MFIVCSILITLKLWERETRYRKMHTLDIENAYKGNLRKLRVSKSILTKTRASRKILINFHNTNVKLMHFIVKENLKILRN